MGVVTLAEVITKVQKLGFVKPQKEKATFR